jgi:hypothetical protein
VQRGIGQNVGSWPLPQPRGSEARGADFAGTVSGRSEWGMLLAPSRISWRFGSREECGQHEPRSESGQQL